jgi:hypothetical protein
MNTLMTAIFGPTATTLMGKSLEKGVSSAFCH